MTMVPLRLRPCVDPRRVLEAWMGVQEEQAGYVISAVGSLSVVQLRLAEAAEATMIHSWPELVGLRRLGILRGVVWLLAPVNGNDPRH